MIKTLLSAVLVGTQVLSWIAAPVFVCLDADGSFCLDFGPQTCRCCRHEDQADGCHHEHGRHDTELDHSLATRVDPCGCVHVRISEPKSATLTRATRVPDAERSVVPPAAAGEVAAGCAVLATCPSAFLSRAVESPPGALAVLTTVVMRC